MLDLCVENPIEGENGKEDFPNEDILDVKLGTWKMYVDRTVNQYGNGIGILLITLKGSHIPLAIKLNFKATNNMAEYEACIAGMEALHDLRVKGAKVFGDSTLVRAQAQKLWKVKEEHLKSYQQYLENLTKTFDKIEYTIIPRAQNQFADALATIAFVVEIPEGVWTRPLEIEPSYEEMHKGKTETLVMTIEGEEVPWYYDIMKFLELGAYLDGADKRERCSIRMMAKVLRWYTHSLLEERRSQEGNGRSSSRDLWSSYEWENVNQENPKDRYYWNTMEIDCMDYVKVAMIVKHTLT
ncbi:uncharacterized protein LOC115956660 [Quercus lobata]|uniref:uncharacterized protein LOC115956660 n=1 Tax=Quercus lobata TaxID=97700 RepID=UPI0012470D3B|nr:uncharacterized protein LOC115956660 [Quercus lobata]